MRRSMLMTWAAGPSAECSSPKLRRERGKWKAVEALCLSVGWWRSLPKHFPAISIGNVVDQDGNNVISKGYDWGVKFGNNLNSTSDKCEGKVKVPPEWIAPLKILLPVQRSWQVPPGFSVSPSPVDKDCSNDDFGWASYHSVFESQLCPARCMIRSALKH